MAENNADPELPHVPSKADPEANDMAFWGEQKTVQAPKAGGFFFFNS